MEDNLKEIINIILKGIVQNDILEKILDEDSLTNYWTVAFTHKSADADKNNSLFAFYGLDVMKFAFSQYLREKFEDELDTNKITLLTNKYINSTSLIAISEKLDLVKYVKHDSSLHKNDDLIIKAFFGCLNNVINDKVIKHFGYICCYDLLEVLFNDITDEVEVNAKTQLKEIYDKRGWTQPTYVFNRSNNECLIRNKSRCIVGVGYGLQKKVAELSAAGDALNKLAKKGITLETTNKEKNEQRKICDQEYEKQYKRVKEAIQKHNDQGQRKIVEFEIVNLGNFREPRRYTFAIKVAYQDSDDEIYRKIIFKSTGTKQTETKLKVMTEFADLYNVDI